MKIITINTNGIRAADRKGFFEWIKKENPDVVCIQETKAQFDQLEDKPQFQPQGYFCKYHDAVKKGYSGVAIYSKKKPKNVTIGFGDETIDCEGRFIEFEFENFSVVSIYMHSGTAGTQRQVLKEEFMSKLYNRLQEHKKANKNYIVCGDINIVHTEKDIKNAKGNKNSSGFLPHERDWLSKLFTNGYKDSFRLVDDRAEQYTWWSNRGQAWANNTGWRIDYQIISDELSSLVKSATVYREQRFSDHSPLIVNYDCEL